MGGGRPDEYGKMIKITPFGMVVCVVELYDCVTTEECVTTEQERAHGDYSPRRFAWKTRNLRQLNEPVPVIGRQGLFNLPLEVEAQVRAQI